MERGYKMRIPNYTEMKHMLAQRESESISQKDIYEILLFGTKGWNDCDNEQIFDDFIKLFGEHQIPKVEVTK
jgi:hypothetical protein